MKQLVLHLLPVICALTAMPAKAQSDTNDLLRLEIEALKREQTALRRELEALKQQLPTARRSPPLPSRDPVQAVDGVLDIGDAPMLGRFDAPLTLVEFSDYQCPACRRYVQNTLPQLVQGYISAGQVRYVFHDFPLTNMHKQARKAAEAAHCAGDQGKYWPMHDQLFANQKTLAMENLVEQASALDLDMASFRQCLESGKYAEKVALGVDDGERLGVSATPTFILGVSDGGAVKDSIMLRGAHPFSVFKREIDALLKGAAPKTNQP